MHALTASQKHRIKALAHARKPVVMVGVHGLTPAVLAEIHLALDHHELIKIRIHAEVHAEDRKAREAMISALCAATEAILVQRIGHVATVFRRNPAAPRVLWAEEEPSP